MVGETEALFQELTENAGVSCWYGFICGCGTWVPYGQSHSCGGMYGEQQTGTAGYTCVFCKDFVGWGAVHTCLFQDQDTVLKLHHITYLLHLICDKLGISYYVKGSVEEFLTDVMGEEESAPVEELMKLVTCGCGTVKEFNTDDGWHCPVQKCVLGTKNAL